MQYGLNGSDTKKDEFFDWISQQKPSAQLTDAPSILTDMEKFCASRRLICKSIFDISDKDEVEGLRIRLNGDRLFHFLNREKAEMMLLLLEYYLQYLEQSETATSESESAVAKSQQPEAAAASTHKAAEEKHRDALVISACFPAANAAKDDGIAEFLSDFSQPGGKNPPGDTLITYFQLNSIPYVDERPHGGRLWMIGGKTLETDANVLRARGFHFCFAPNGSKSTHRQSAWYLTDRHQISTFASQDSLEPSIPCQMSHKLEELLAGDDMQLLRNELLKQGILTLEQFKQINPWGFMNRYVLYSVSQRQEIYKRILQRLRTDKIIDSEQRFLLKTRTASYSGTIPAEAFVCFCEHIAQKYPLNFRSLLDIKYDGQDAIVLSRIDQYGDSIKLMNPEAYVNRQLTSQTALIYGQWICKMCGESEWPVEMDEPTQKDELVAEGLPRNQTKSTEKPPVVSALPVLEPKVLVSDEVLIQKIEKCIRSADLDGMTIEALRKALNATAASIKNAVANTKHIIMLNGKLFHDEAFVDWEDGADQLEEILDKLLARNDGYLSAAQLYEYVHADMQMFLNDNDIDDLYMVYDMARYWFEKLDRHHKRLVFQGNHISRETAVVKSNLDVIRNYARKQGGVFREEDLIQYLQSLGIKTGNLRGQMRVYEKPIFMFYDTETYITVESMCIDDSWFHQVRKALACLFVDMGDHVVLRDIQPWWYTQLPMLPNGKKWTALLLQNVLKHYSEALDGAQTIFALSTQTANTLHAMLVSSESEIQNFADAVIAFLIDDEISQRRFESEELRQILVRRGMIAGSELYSIMPKALARDERFSWDAGQQYVTVKV